MEKRLYQAVAALFLAALSGALACGMTGGSGGTGCGGSSTDTGTAPLTCDASKGLVMGQDGLCHAAGH